MAEWIDVNERLPLEDERVFVCCQTKKGVKSVNIAYQSEGIWHGSGSMSGVIAWMPLPELPQEPKEEKKGGVYKRITMRRIAWIMTGTALKSATGQSLQQI